MLDGLADYVRAMDPATPRCDRTVGITIAGVLDEIAQAVRLARFAAADGDPATARLLLGAARSNLGRIDERFQAPGLGPERAMIEAASRDLAAIQSAPSEPAGWSHWERSWPNRSATLRRAEPRSLYSEARLRKALASRD